MKKQHPHYVMPSIPTLNATACRLLLSQEQKCSVCKELCLTKNAQVSASKLPSAFLSLIIILWWFPSYKLVKLCMNGAFYFILFSCNQFRNISSPGCVRFQSPYLHFPVTYFPEVTNLYFNSNIMTSRRRKKKQNILINKKIICFSYDLFQTLSVRSSKKNKNKNVLNPLFILKQIIVICFSMLKFVE